MSDQTEQLPPIGSVVVATDSGPLDAGTAGLYIRTEQRPGDDEPLALVLVVQDRVVHQRWTAPSRFSAEWAVEYRSPVEQPEAKREQVELARKYAALVEAMRSVEPTVADTVALDSERPYAESCAQTVAKSLRATYREAMKESAG